MGIQHVNYISTLWKLNPNTFCLHFWAICLLYHFNSGHWNWSKTVFKINATCSVILLHHAKTCTNFYVWLLHPNTFRGHCICLYTHFVYTPSFSITQFFPLSQEQLNKMWKTVFVIVYTLHLHGCVRGCLEGFICVKMCIPVLIYLIFWWQHVCSNYVLQFLTLFFFNPHPLTASSSKSSHR